MTTITWNTDVNAPCCPGEIVADDGRSILVQTDWDYPSVARTFGWTTERVQRCPECGIVHLAPEDICSRGYPVEFICPECRQRRINECPHDTTDGSVDCECGMPASEFITAAGEWLRDNHGLTARDPGYFDSED